MNIKPLSQIKIEIEERGEQEDVFPPSGFTSLSKENKLDLYFDGITVLRNALPKSIVKKMLGRINFIIGKGKFFDTIHIYLIFILFIVDNQLDSMWMTTFLMPDQ